MVELSLHPTGDGSGDKFAKLTLTIRVSPDRAAELRELIETKPEIPPLIVEPTEERRAADALEEERRAADADYRAKLTEAEAARLAHAKAMSKESRAAVADAERAAADLVMPLASIAADLAEAKRRAEKAERDATDNALRIRRAACRRAAEKEFDKIWAAIKPQIESAVTNQKIVERV